MDVTLFWSLFSLLLSSVVYYLSLLCPLPSYLLLHIRGRNLVLMLKDVDECCTSEVNLA